MGGKAIQRTKLAFEFGAIVRSCRRIFKPGFIVNIA